MAYLQRVPRLSPNEDRVLLGEWVKKNDECIRCGEVIALLEATKIVAEVEAESDGYLVQLVEECSHTRVGEPLAILKDSQTEAIDTLLAELEGRKKAAVGGGGRQWTRKAELLAKKHNIDISEMATNGFVREADVLAAINSLGYTVDEAREEVETHETPAIEQSVSGRKIIILGGGGHAKTCIDLLRQQNSFEIYGIIDEYTELGHEVLGVPIIGRHDDLERLYNEGYHWIVNGIGALMDHPVREQHFKKLKDIGFSLPNLVHPKSVVEPSVLMGEGNQIMANATVGSSVVLGDNCIVNSGAVLSHDSVLGNNVHIAPGAILASAVSVGNNTLVGMGCTVFLQVRIGHDVAIMNGCDVIEDVPDNKMVRKSL